jgi:hypothetical protein
MLRDHQTRFGLRARRESFRDRCAGHLGGHQDQGHLLQPTGDRYRSNRHLSMELVMVKNTGRKAKQLKFHIESKAVLT